MKKLFCIFGILTLAAVMLSAGEAGAEAAKAVQAVNPFKGTFWALLPPLLAIVLALLTKEVYFSLFAGIVLGGCFSAAFSPFKIVDVIIKTGLIKAVQDIAGILIFLVLLGIIVSLMNKSGGAAAFGRWTQNRIKSRKGTIFATFFLGILIFVDDYFNCLTVGSVMKPVTDKKLVSRAKLAYIIDATAAPICMIAPISSWAAAVSQYAEGTKYTGLQMFIMAIPYNFYSWLTLIFILLITALNIDFGPMAKHERNALENGDIFSGKQVAGTLQTEDRPNSRVIDMMVPIGLLILICVFALLYVGGILDGKNFIAAFGDTDASVALSWGAVIAVLISALYLLCRGAVKLTDVSQSIVSGFNAMVPAILILTMATGLKNITSALECKEFIAHLISNSAPGLAQFLPAVIFIVACVLAFSTGTSWGTFGILIPIVCSIFPAESPLLFIGMSACLAGAVCGDHCSPISDTTVMSSAGAQCDHITHVSTQLPYVCVVAGISFIGFLLAGIICNWFIVFPIQVAIMLAVLLFIKYKFKNS